VKRRAFSPKRSRGAVLLLVLGAVALLSVLAVELAHRANVDVTRSVRSSRDTSFRRTLDSGAEIAKALILEGRNSMTFDSQHDAWSRNVQHSLPSGEHLSVQVADESGKLNLLKAVGSSEQATRMRKCLARLFARLRQLDSEREREWENVETAVRKRIGITEAPPKPGAATEQPFEIAPLLTLDGLREAGVPAEFVFGSRGGHENSRWALCDVLTTFGDGRINLNTAPAPVLYAIDEEYDDALVNNIELWRGKPTGDGQRSGKSFEKPQDLERVAGVVQKHLVNGQEQIFKNLFTKVQDRLSVSSTCFSAQLTAQIEGRSRVAWVFFDSAAHQPQPGRPKMPKVIAFEEIEP